MSRLYDHRCRVHTHPPHPPNWVRILPGITVRTLRREPRGRYIRDLLRSAEATPRTRVERRVGSGWTPEEENQYRLGKWAGLPGVCPFLFRASLKVP